MGRKSPWKSAVRQGTPEKPHGVLCVGHLLLGMEPALMCAQWDSFGENKFSLFSNCQLKKASVFSLFFNFLLVIVFSIIANRFFFSHIIYPACSFSSIYYSWFPPTPPFTQSLSLCLPLENKRASKFVLFGGSYETPRASTSIRCNSVQHWKLQLATSPSCLYIF